MKVLGLMSGTSLDAVDCALCDCRGRGLRLDLLWSVTFPATLRSRLHAAARGELTTWQTAQLHHDLGRFYAKAAKRGLRGTRAEAVGLQGQTVFHHPDRLAPATLQLGEPAYLVEALRVPVVSNFRAADLAAGGQGAPLATLFHRTVLARRGRYVAVNNLGGISNVTALDWTDAKRNAPRVLAFDTGPANMLLDLAVRDLSSGRQRFDREGRWATRGRVNLKLVHRWLKDGYFIRPPPKSTGRERFGEPFWRRACREMNWRKLDRFDVLATLTEFTAGSLALNYDRHLRTRGGTLPEEVILTGGGARNPKLVEHIAVNLHALRSDLSVRTCDEFGWPPEAIEPAAFALLAHYRLRGWPANLPETTGARRAALLGQVSEP